MTITWPNVAGEAKAVSQFNELSEFKLVFMLANLCEYTTLPLVYISFKVVFQVKDNHRKGQKSRKF